jgi:hypothetical protein
MKRILLAALVVLVVSGGAKADPGPVVQWLMNEPASLFDLGMYRLEKDTERKKIPIFGTSSDIMHYASYDWNKNRIKVGYVAYVIPFTKILCKKYLNSARSTLGFVLGGEAVAGASISAKFFQHNGYHKKSQPNKHMNKLDQIITVTVALKGGSCEGPMVSTDVLYRDADK